MELKSKTSKVIGHPAQAWTCGTFQEIVIIISVLLATDSNQNCKSTHLGLHHKSEFAELTFLDITTFYPPAQRKGVKRVLGNEMFNIPPVKTLLMDKFQTSSTQTRSYKFGFPILKIKQIERNRLSSIFSTSSPQWQILHTLPDKERLLAAVLKLSILFSSSLLSFSDSLSFFPEVLLSSPPCGELFSSFSSSPEIGFHNYSI